MQADNTNTNYVFIILVAHYKDHMAQESLKLQFLAYFIDDTSGEKLTKNFTEHYLRDWGKPVLGFVLSFFWAFFKEGDIGGLSTPQHRRKKNTASLQKRGKTPTSQFKFLSYD